MTNAEKQEHLYELLSDFNTAMLLTRSPDGVVRGRPMSVAELEPDADAYFATSIESPKVAEILEDPHVTITFQSSSKFASVSGTVEVVQDRALIERLWSESWRVWFPEGKDDPSLCVLRFDARDGEYWDQSGARGIKYAFEAAKAYLTGTTPTSVGAQNAKVPL